MTLVVVGLDAADYRLIKEWDLDNLLLENHGPLETFAHSKDIPITSEVWPAIATGRLPDEGGARGTRGSDWTGVMSLLESVASRTLPQRVRTTIGRYLRAGKTIENHFLPSEGDHAFRDGVVYNWPGVTPAKNWSRSETWLARLNDGEISDGDFFRVQMGLTGEELGWALAMASCWYPIVATRCHVLDHAGHAWASQPGKLRSVYKRVDDLVGTLQASEAVTELVICSDHGMQTIVTEDHSPGTHSWDAYVASTNPGTLPERVESIRSWLDERRPAKPEIGEEWIEGSVDTDESHLQDLGYI